MKKISSLLTMVLIGFIGLALMQCGQNSKSAEDKPPVTKSTEEQDTAPFDNEKKLTNTIVLIVDVDLLKPPDQMDSTAYEEACKFDRQNNNKSLKEYTTTVKKKAKVIWAGEPADEESEAVILIEKIELVNEADGNILTDSVIVGGNNGLAVGHVKRNIQFPPGKNKKEQSYRIFFTVDGVEYSFDPKLRVIK